MSTGIAFLISSSQIFAGDSEFSTHEMYFSLFAGLNFENSGKTTTVNFGGLATNQYQPNRVYKIGPLWGFDIGRQHWYASNRWVRYGFESSYTRVIKMSGLVHPLFNINPNFDTLTYTYAIRSVPFLFVTQLGFATSNKNETYLIGGAGISWNQASDYNEVPTQPALTAAPMRIMFKTHSALEFVYTIGAGFSHSITHSASWGLEYRFTGYGPAQLGNNGTSVNGLYLGPIHSNEILARLTIQWLS